MLTHAASAPAGCCTLRWLPRCLLLCLLCPYAAGGCACSGAMP